MKRRVQPRPIGFALDRVTAQLAPQTPLAAVQRVWAQAVGPAVAAAARPTAERNGTVFVTCESAVWSNEITLLAQQLVDSINTAIGRPAISAIKASAGPARR